MDVFALASGFGLRAVQGHVAAGVPVAPWLVVSVFSACLLLALGKRRGELGGDRAHRPALRGYTTGYLDHLLVLSAAVTATACLNFASSTAALDGPAVVGCALLALFSLARYLQVVLVSGQGGDPVRLLLRDRALVVTSLLSALFLGGCLLLAHVPRLTEHLN